MKLLMYLLRYKCATQRCLIEGIMPGTKKIFLICIIAIAYCILLLGSTIGCYLPNKIYLHSMMYLDIVRKYHPVAKQANLIVDSAKANRLAAKGAFDPSFYVSNQQKTFDGKNYYFYTNPELKIPTWYGVDLKADLKIMAAKD